MNQPDSVPKIGRRAAVGRFFGTVVSSAAVGGVAGFLANQVADYYKHERDTADDLMKEEVKDARSQLVALADELKTKTPKSVAEIDPVITSLRRKQNAFKTPKASSMISEELGRLESAKAELMDSERSRKDADAKEAQRKEAQERKDAEAAAKAAAIAAQRSSDAKIQAERAELMLQRTEERIRHAKGF